MSKEPRHPFESESLCLSSQQLLAYTEGKLNAQENRKVEMHLADCPLCSDAVDGVSGLYTGFAGASLERLDKKMSDRISPRSFAYSFIRRVIAVAALLALVIVAAFFLNELISKKQMQYAYKSETKSDDKGELQVSDSIKNSVLREVNTEPDELASVTVNKQTQTGKITEDFSNSDESIKFIPPVEETKKNVVSPSVQHDNKDAAPVTFSTDDVVQFSSTSETLPTSPNSSQNNYDFAAEQLNDVSGNSVQNINLEEVQIVGKKKNDYTKNSHKEKESAPTAPQNNSMLEGDLPSDLFNDAMIAKSAGNYNDAISKLNELIKLNNDLKPQALWEKALLLIELKKTDKAKDILKELSAGNSDYKNSAVQKLNELR